MFLTRRGNIILFHLIIKNDKNTYKFESDKHSVKIGRSTTADFTIPFDDLSREHCLIELDDGQFYITDLESKNGIFINQIRIDSLKRIPLLPEYVISLTRDYSLSLNSNEEVPVKKLRIVEKKQPTATVTMASAVEGPKKPVKVQLEERPQKKKIQPPPIPKEAKKRPLDYKVIAGVAIVLIALVYGCLQITMP